jgi:hypothetical protein
MTHAVSSASCLYGTASSLARISFGNTLKTELLDPPSVSLFDHNDVAVDTQLLADVREMSE